jgi:hypothetical protein
LSAPNQDSLRRRAVRSLRKKIAIEIAELRAEFERHLAKIEER